MDRRSTARYEARLERLFDLSASLPADGEVRAHWARYLCILLSGYLEKGIREAATQHVKSRSAPTVFEFAFDAIESSLSNPGSEVILKFIGSFDVGMRKRLETFIAGERKEGVDSLVNLRNRAAHGEDSGVSIEVTKRWFRVARETVAEIESILR